MRLCVRAWTRRVALFDIVNDQKQAAGGPVVAPAVCSFAPLAQLAEQPPCKGQVAGSNPCTEHQILIDRFICHLLTEGSAEWSATGPENQGDREVRGSIPQPSANSRDQGSGISYQART